MLCLVQPVMSIKCPMPGVVSAYSVKLDVVTQIDLVVISLDFSLECLIKM